MKNFIQEGNVIGISAPYDVSSGDGVFLTSVFGVATNDALSGADVEIATTGVYDLAKKSTDTPAVGAKAYWDDTLKHITTTATAMKLVGVFTTAAGNGDTSVNVRLNGVTI